MHTFPWKRTIAAGGIIATAGFALNRPDLDLGLKFEKLLNSLSMQLLGFEQPLAAPATAVAHPGRFPEVKFRQSA